MPNRTVLVGSVMHAIRFYEIERDELYIGIGKADPWEGKTKGGGYYNVGDLRPPFPSTAEKGLIDPIGYKRVRKEDIYFAKIDSEVIMQDLTLYYQAVAANQAKPEGVYGDIESIYQEADPNVIFYGGLKYRMVARGDAVEQAARWLYFYVYIDPEDFGDYGEFRQCGIFTRLKRKDDVDPDKYNLLPEEVEDTGNLEVLSNRPPVSYTPDISRLVAFMIEF